MRWFAVLVGLVIAAFGILGIAAPTVLLEVAAFALTQAGFYVAAALRIAFGLVLIAAAAGSRLPRTLRTLGALFVVAGIVTPIIGVERARALVHWWSSHGSGFTRVWAVLPAILGLFVIYAATPRRVSG
jgi:hypothetical protein